MQKLFNFVGVPGLEPGLTEPKSVVLPLHHTPKSTPYIHIPGVRTTKIYQLCTKNGTAKCEICYAYFVRVSSVTILYSPRLNLKITRVSQRM